MDYLTEGFDDVTTLTKKGWILVNKSQPLGDTSWFQGSPFVFPEQDGYFFGISPKFYFFQKPPFFHFQLEASNSYIAASYDNVGTEKPEAISNWLISPVVKIQNEDLLSFYTRTTGNYPVYPDRLQVRLSLNGASANIGSTSTSIGDFTTLLLDVNPNLIATGYPTAFKKYEIRISGVPTPSSGRIAFRYFIPTNAGPSGKNGDYIGLDSFSYGSGNTNFDFLPASLILLPLAILCAIAYIRHKINSQILDERQRSNSE